MLVYCLRDGAYVYPMNEPLNDWNRSYHIYPLPAYCHSQPLPLNWGMGNVLVEWHTISSSASTAHCHGHGQNCIGANFGFAPAPLVFGAIDPQNNACSRKPMVKKQVCHAALFKHVIVRAFVNILQLVAIVCTPAPLLIHQFTLSLVTWLW